MPRFSRRFMRHMKKASKCHEEDNKNPRFSCRSEDSSHPSWVENLVQILTDWANIPAEAAKDDAPETAEAAQEVPKAPNAPKESPKSPTSVLNDLRQSPLCDNVIYKMQNLLDNSLQFLDPLGVDVSINVEPAAGANEKSSPASSAPSAPQDKVLPTVDKETSESDKAAQNIEDDQASSSSSTKSDRASPARPNSEVEGWTLLNASENPNPSMVKQEEKVN